MKRFRNERNVIKNKKLRRVNQLANAQFRIETFVNKTTVSESQNENRNYSIESSVYVNLRKVSK